VAADLTVRIRAKLDEVKHAEDCLTVSYQYTVVHACTCDRPQRVADLVRRIGNELAAQHFFGASLWTAWEAALAVPSEEEEEEEEEEKDD